RSGFNGPDTARSLDLGAYRIGLCQRMVLPYRCTGARLPPKNHTGHDEGGRAPTAYSFGNIAWHSACFVPRLFPSAVGRLPVLPRSARPVSLGLSRRASAAVARTQFANAR